MKQKVALVYDRVNKWGGAERVLLVLHEMFPEAPLYTSVYNPGIAKWASVFPKVYTSFLQNIPFARTHHEWFAALMPLAFEQFDFSKYDLVVSVTSEFGKSIITSPHQKHICYCLTPTRYLWSGYDDYFKKSWLRFLAVPVVNYLRKVDKISAKRPDAMIAISTEVQSRIRKYYKRDSQIIFPPVNIKKNPHYMLHSTYYLLVSRLVPYKKVDLAVKAFNKNGLPLVIVGTGFQEQKLKEMAKSDIRFVGYITDDELNAYYKGCKALIFPQEEDFGLVAVEAISHGKPVVAFKAGGALDIIKEGVNGLFFEAQSVGSLNKAIKRLFTKKWSSAIIISTSSQFSKERFKKEFLKVIQL
ncbi:hypothetical protein A2803_03725 [Candidatus Woesebacteria bacterium RIFCSPHIGHO2_01_FULL_44_21]|uniref:Glycosyl transferase family 1 domain-containing protein n=1 Tax=Candidatus Woesebacteria bacterium RIFCSPHIGHO2_01_FULL_44_21 TaxID=1802503 RepID=A0A1F7YXT0_9BACT|nr:MAG: hypothetical protein A2803_03725 [Candidatus Woesebacteria bacterium RIFCSPHIGHO2_01_FULL_44_21]